MAVVRAAVGTGNKIVVVSNPSQERIEVRGGALLRAAAFVRRALRAAPHSTPFCREPCKSSDVDISEVGSQWEAPGPSEAPLAHGGWG